jgi:type IX secretion system substrate protein
MRIHHRILIVVLVAIIALPAVTQAQLPGPGNLDWQEVWVNYPPPSADPSNPNYWMFGNNTFTGLAYDKINDVVYIVNPGTCRVGNVFFKCPRIFAWNADNGSVASQISHPSAPQAGQLYVNTGIVDGGFSLGQYSIYRIDLDDQGRIYASNVVAPVFGVCFPGPPPACLPEFLSQGPWKVYRWDSYLSSPELVYATAGDSPLNSEMTWGMWGTSFDVVGKETIVNGQAYDSTRIYVSGGKFYVGYFTVNDEINVMVHDDRVGAPRDFRFGVRLQHNSPGSGIAAHSIAATGPYKISQLWMDSNFREVVLNNQNQDNSAMPQTFPMALNDPLPDNVTKESGAIKYFLDDRFQIPYLICADGMPSSRDPGTPNLQTSCRVVDLSTKPAYKNWPLTDTPPLGNERFNNLTGEDNWITDVDYKVWINPSTGEPHLQVFVLMSKNGIGCYRTREPIPFKPVEMTTFRGLVNGSNIDLSWQVVSETNNHGFEVHRSFNNGSDWENIGFVPGRGTTTSAAEYAFSDQITMIHEAVGVVKYRLRQVDFDGTNEVTDAIDVYIGSSSALAVLNQNFPNPFNPSTKISYQMQEPGYVTLKVFNSIGDEVASLVQESKNAGLHIAEFDASHLPSGSYMYQLNVNGNMQQKKMVLIK